MDYQSIDNQPEQSIYEQQDPYSPEFYIEMKLWGILSDMLDWVTYSKYCGRVSLYKPVCKILNHNQRDMFQRLIGNKFGINFTLRNTDRMTHIVKRIINS